MNASASWNCVRNLEFVAVLGFGTLLPGITGLGEEPKSPAPEDQPPKLVTEAAPGFKGDILPILRARCWKCHGEKGRKAKLDLRTYASIRKGSESGEVIVPGSAEKSQLYEMIAGGDMPPDESLSESEVALIRRWLDGGAPQVSEHSPTATETAKVDRITEHDILPILQLRCVVCHGKRRRESDLDLRTRESILKGGKSGSAIVLGKPDQSLMIEKIVSEAMPPLKEQGVVSVRPVTSGELVRIKQWIADGAPQSPPEYYAVDRGPDRLVTDEDRRHWAYQSPKRPPVPAVRHMARVRNPIDAFLLAKLEAAGLSYSPEADRRTLMRRLYFDLTGLPPDPNEVAAFLADERPDAYKRLFNRLLASPEYGERWASFWLDAAGYADSEGKRSRDTLRKHAWRYRDYVIRAMDSDMPYDRFLLEQIAGDELVDYRSKEQLTTEEANKLIATGFLRLAPDGTDDPPVNFVPDRWEVISDELEVLCTTVLATTITCAKCHSHKYDPIPQRDYYKLAAIFGGSYDPHDWVGNHKRFVGKVAGEERAAWEADERQTSAEIAAVKATLKATTESFQEKWRTKELAKLLEAIREDVRKAIATEAGDRDAVEKYLAGKFEQDLEVDGKQLAASFPEYKTAADEADKRIKRLEAGRKPEPMIRALYEMGGTPSPAYILLRGDPLAPGRLISPGPPAVFSNPDEPFVIDRPWDHYGSSGRRLALAKWLVHPGHPATARVMVNRIWYHHFGRGIVETVGNFGLTGAAPTHPELLDWLALEFIDRGWSMKQMHRLMVSSSAYRQISALTPELDRADHDNKLFSRMPLARLDAEVVRDSILKVAGRLDSERFGEPSPIEVQPDGNVVSKQSPRGSRRSIYMLHRRTTILSVLEAFDKPQLSPNCLSRRQSIVASQALQLMNGESIRRSARHFAQRVRGEVGSDAQAQIQRAYRLALARAPEETEEQQAMETIHSLRRHWTSELDSAAEQNGQDQKADQQAAAVDDQQEQVELRALTGLCHALLNSAEFIYVD